jgi:methanogenic corrinoid protein MtbC1
VIIGGAPLSQSFCEEIGADAYGVDAMDAVVKVKELMGL